MSGTQSDRIAKERKVFALSQLASSISSHLDRTFSGSYWITAEISKLNHYPQSGHCYPQLVEKREGQIVAEIRSFILKSRYAAINQKFLEIAGTSLADGMQIMFLCKVSYHAVYGLQLNLLDIEPAYTMGEMARMRQEAIAKLKSEGIFAQNKLHRTPLLFRRVAVISVETSKGWRDFAQVLEHSKYPKATTTRIFPALLQGDAAVGSIMAALEKIARVRDQFDAVAIIRGGGGEVGLDCYDNYKLGKAICTFPIPVITGIGHATNLTLAEQVAHKNLITPTDLARYISDGFERFAERVQSARRSLAVLRKGWFELHRAQLDRRKVALQNAYKKRGTDEVRSLRQDTRHLAQAAKDATAETHRKLTYQLPARLREVVKDRLGFEAKNTRTLVASLSRFPAENLKDEKNQLALMREKIKLLDPANALKRGYSIAMVGGKVVRSATELKAGDRMDTIFAEGRAESTVTKTIS